MTQDKLRDLLARIHERSSGNPSVDPESRELLGAVMRDIEKTGSPAEHPGPRLEALAVRFEADHPALAEGLRELIDLLGKAGI